MGSARISSEDTLDMEPVDDEWYPWPGTVSVPRPVVQAVGCLMEGILKPRQTVFLGRLAKALEGDGRDFFSLFLIVFVLLHECENISKDRYRYARENSKAVGISMTKRLTSANAPPDSIRPARVCQGSP